MRTTAEEMADQLVYAARNLGLNLYDMHDVFRVLGRAGFSTAKINVFCDEALQEAREKVQ